MHDVGNARWVGVPCRVGKMLGNSTVLGHLVLNDDVLVWLSVWSEVQMICMWSS